MNKVYKGNYTDFQDSRGYFLGRFMKERGFPDLKTDSLELAYMILPEVDYSLPHYHKIASEVTICLTGRLNLIVEGQETTLVPGEFLLVPPGTVLQNPTNEPGTTIFVLKWPSVADDKYYA